MSDGKYIAACDVLDTWREDVLTGKAPVLYPMGDGELRRVEIGPGLVDLFGGPPGVGKTAFAMQATVDALRLTPTLRALVVNVEMAPAALLDRQLARLSGVGLTPIRYRRLGAEHSDRIDRGLSTLAHIAERLCFLHPPFTLENVAATADAFGAGFIVLDYIQRIAPPGEHGDRRGQVDATMSILRQFADAGVAVLVVSAVARSKDAKGRSSYAEGLSLASFRESSELEYGADSAYMLVGNGDGACEDGPDAPVTLKCFKNRHGEQRDIALRFDGARQAFRPVLDGKLTAGLQSLWASTQAAPDDWGGRP